MYLKSIELSGFKSFAKKSELLFTSRISSIVGPNGSGKSNVAEAFRFVLGEQSIKSLRGKKGEDLIFNGGGGESKGNRASVKVVFDNSSKIFAIDFPEISIERVVHRDGVNDYFINGSPVRLKDVLELLLGAHIGASGHHIISQGEADKILNTTPKERKAMIEDALGLRLYQYKRIESERKLKKTFENIKEVESLRREIAPHLKFLRKQVEKMEKAESMKSDLIEKAKLYFKSENMYLAFSKTILLEERTPIDEKLKRLEDELKQARNILESEKHKDHGSEILRLESEISEARKSKDNLVLELGKIEGLIAGEERVIRKQKEAAAADVTKMIRLRDVELFFNEIQEDVKEAEHKGAVDLLHLIRDFGQRLTSFIAGKKDAVDQTVVSEAEKAIEGFNADKTRIKDLMQQAEAKDLELHGTYELMKKSIEAEKDSSRDAEKAVFRIMSEENELIARLSLIKAREENVKKDEAELMRGLEEAVRLGGSEILKFKDMDIEFDESSWVSKREEEKREIGKLVIRLEDAGISGSDEVVKEFRDANERDEFLARELLDLEQSAESLRSLIEDLEKRLAIEFATGIARINSEFGELFKSMFGGGSAELKLTREKKVSFAESEEEDMETEEKIEEGLDISVTLPRKKIHGLMMLSGGERALTSIALLFAISAVNPPPFIILDETDAALDEANSKRYGDMVERLSKHSQLILITHNRETMSRAGIIYGVTMSSTGVSKLLSIEFDQAVEVAK
jgi:chromosome segregation protein